MSILEMCMGMRITMGMGIPCKSKVTNFDKKQKLTNQDQNTLKTCPVEAVNAEDD